MTRGALAALLALALALGACGKYGPPERVRRPPPSQVEPTEIQEEPAPPADEAEPGPSEVEGPSQADAAEEEPQP